MLGAELDGVDQPSVIHRAEVDVRQVHQRHFAALEVGDGHADGKNRGTGIQLCQRFSIVVEIKCQGVLVAPAQADIGSAFIFTQHQVRLVVRGIGQIAMQGMVILRAWYAHGSRAAVQQESTEGG